MGAKRQPATVQDLYSDRHSVWQQEPLPKHNQAIQQTHVFKCNRWLDGDLLLAYHILFPKRARGGLSFVHEGFVKPIQESVCAGVAQKRKGPTGKPIVTL